MAQAGLIARAGKGLLDIFALLLRGMGALCAAFGSLFLAAASCYNSDHDSSRDQEAMPDGLTDLEREDEARIEGWKSW